MEITEQDKKKIAADAAAASRQLMADLSKEFPGDPEFAQEQFAKGSTVIEAKAAYADKLQADLDLSEDAKKKAEAEVAKLQAGKVTPAKPGPDPVKFAGGASETEGGKDFLQLADEYAKDNRCGIQQAMSAVARKNPEVHRVFVAEQRAQPARKIERAAAK